MFSAVDIVSWIACRCCPLFPTNLLSPFSFFLLRSLFALCFHPLFPLPHAHFTSLRSTFSRLSYIVCTNSVWSLCHSHSLLSMIVAILCIYRFLIMMHGCDIGLAVDTRICLSLSFIFDRLLHPIFSFKFFRSSQFVDSFAFLPVHLSLKIWSSLLWIDCLLPNNDVMRVFCCWLTLDVVWTLLCFHNRMLSFPFCWQC